MFVQRIDLAFRYMVETFVMSFHINHQISLQFIQVFSKSPLERNY